MRRDVEAAWDAVHHQSHARPLGHVAIPAVVPARPCRGDPCAWSTEWSAERSTWPGIRSGIPLCAPCPASLGGSRGSRWGPPGRMRRIASPDRVVDGFGQSHSHGPPWPCKGSWRSARRRSDARGTSRSADAPDFRHLSRARGSLDSASRVAPRQGCSAPTAPGNHLPRAGQRRHMAATDAPYAKQADLAGPGIGDYAELEKILPDDYRSALDPRETQTAIYAVKEYIERNLCKELNLKMVQVPLIVDVESGSTTCSTATGRGRRSSSISRTTTTSTRSTPRSCRRRRSGSAPPCSSSGIGVQARASAPTCGRSARTTSSTTTTAPTSTSGTGSRSSPPKSATSST